VGHRGYFSARKLGNYLMNGKGLEVNIEKKSMTDFCTVGAKYFRAICRFIIHQ
jgi:hypothetical protein